ncbi:anthocyanin regulatory R-S protein-like [Triticum dicoccoides]|uniref:anthocyanin regulatory R-S protein-like n=1 Tax=Triticum dicoccoides TaxID=85692 RepID=UPI00188E3467|nr:anthocyanin regulatory R-S protein-like [Triticum dicoccoides]
MAEAMPLSAAGDCVVSPLRPPFPVKAEPAPTPTEPIERCSWTGVVRVSTPPVWLGASAEQEQACFEQWYQQRLAEEHREGEYLEMLERDAEEERREAEEEEECRARAGPAQPAADNVARAWSTAFLWAGPAPTLITSPAPTPPPPWEPPAGRQLSYHLAAAVRSINWTYAIFWSISTGPAGVLAWKEGFYNGEIKTRKMTSSTTTTEPRSQQLRELYESLLSGGNSDRRARLSPEDLGDAEWYYTISMSYTFRPGQGLPGKSFASNQHVWVYNAQSADTKTFERALLAKTVPIKTVVCIPFMGGVLELGTSDPVLEDSNMVHQIGTSFWELHLPSFPACSKSEEPCSNPSLANETSEAGIMLEDLDHNAIEGMISELREVECLSDVNLECVTKEMDEFQFLLEGLDSCALEDNWVMDRSFESISSPQTVSSMDYPCTEDVIVTLSSSVQGTRPSCFIAWRRSLELKDMVVRVTDTEESQKLLKKIVAGGAWTNNGDGGSMARDRESNIKNHVISERRRRERLNEMFMVLKSLVPSIHKVDKASILLQTIAYLKELEQRVKELESNRATIEWRLHDVVGGKKNVSVGSKRKALEREHNDGQSNIVNVTEM